MKNKRIGKFISIIHRHAIGYLKKEMAPLGLHASHHFILFSLYRQDGISQDELSNHLHVDKATITRTIRKLINDGFVKREPDPLDQRRYCLYLTKRGLDARPKIKAILENWNDILLKDFSDTEMDMAFDLLKRMSENTLKYNQNICKNHYNLSNENLGEKKEPSL